MSFSAALHPNLSFKFCFVRLDGIRKMLSLVSEDRRKSHTVWIKSVLYSGNSGFNDNEAGEPARLILERLTNQKQKLEGKVDFSLTQEDLQLGLGNLESDLQAALAALKKKEKELQEAEIKVVLEYDELNQAKEDPDGQEDEISAVPFKQKKLEDELKQSNLDLATLATEIRDLKLQLKQSDQEISVAESALSLKEEDINKMKNELTKKNEDAASTESELRSRNKLLDSANEVLKKQELEIQELRKGILVKEEELGVSVNLREAEKQKLEVVEANLEKKTTDWLLAHEELKKLADEASKNKRKANETVADFRRVNKLLSDVRSELVLTQRALSSSREKRDEQEQLLEKKLIEVEEQKSTVVTYMTSLNDAKKELDSERVKLRDAEARNQELMLGLSLKKDLIEELQDDLNEERSLLQQAIGEMCSLQQLLNKRNADYEETIELLQVKEEDIVKARLKIQHLSSEQTSLQLLLEGKSLELSNTRKLLEDVNREVAQLMMLMDGKEQLTQATTTLKETEEHAQTIQHQLHDTNLRFPQAENFNDHIAELTKNLVISPKGEDHEALDLSQKMEDKFEDMLKEPDDIFRWQKEQLETELGITRENLRLREMQVLSGQRALTIKDGELKVVLERLEKKEEELRLMKEKSARDVDNLRELYTLTQEKVGNKNVGDLTIEKLQLEAAQSEVEAATSTLEELTEMNHALVSSANLSTEVDYNIHKVHENGINLKKELPFGAVEKELVQLTSLTDQLVKQAGIVDNVM